MSRLHRFAAVGAAVIAVATLAGCSTTVHLEPATDANDPVCAQVSVLLPETVGGFDRVWTDAQGTGAWGDPTVALRCGVDPPAPTALVCTTLGGVDWLVLEQEDARQRLVTYGRDPAVEVTILRGEEVDFASIVDTISSNIQSGLSPATAKCTDRVEFPGTDTDTDTQG